MKLLHVVGNRPHFIKLALLYEAAQEFHSLEHCVVHTGQHYDFGLSGVFFEDLSLPEPDYNLGIGSGSHGIQTGKALQLLDPILDLERPDIVVVYGDTNTTLAGALAARKQSIPVAHVESGLREYTWRVEELNRRLADYCSTLLFCPTERAERNLLEEGMCPDRIFLTGDITYDAFLRACDCLPKVPLQSVPPDYVLATIHRAETVDYPKTLKHVVEVLLSLPLPVVFPVHPRTRKSLRTHSLWDQLQNSSRVWVLDPVGYYDFLTLLQGARLILTDSGGVIKEAFYARKPCVTVDYTNEYMEIYETGANILAGKEVDTILKAVEQLFDYDCSRINPNRVFGDGRAAHRMAELLAKREGTGCR